MYNCYYGTRTPKECVQRVSQSGANNGDVIGYMYKDSRHTNLRHKAEFTYDSLNRLSSAIATPVSPGTVSYNLDFLPDRWGNTKCVTDAQTNGPCPNWTFDTAKNQINTSGFTYDAAGDMTADGSCSYTWDAEGRLTSVGGTGCSAASYTYNALGQRVEKLVGSSTYTEIVYGAFGQTLAFHNRSTWTDQFFYLGATPFAKYQGNVTYFIHGNLLGSTTMVYNHTGGTVVQDEIFYPWGERWAYGGTLYDERFASLGRRDAESTLDPTLFRMYESRLYRWLSPDPLAGDILNPQSLNRYAYVLNNPMTLTDPLGLQHNDCSDPWYWASHASCSGPPPCVAYGTEGCILPPFGFPRGGGGGGGGGGSGGGPATTLADFNAFLDKLPCLDAATVSLLEQDLLDLFNQTFGTHKTLNDKGVTRLTLPEGTRVVSVGLPPNAGVPVQVAQLPPDAGVPASHGDFGLGVRIPRDLPGPSDYGHIVFNPAPGTAIYNAQIHGDIGALPPDVVTALGRAGARAFARHFGQFLREHTTQRNPGCTTKFAGGFF